MPVVLVFAFCCLSQVCNFVVGTVSVFMVQHKRHCPSWVVHAPNNSVLCIRNSVNGHPTIPRYLHKKPCPYPHVCWFFVSTNFPVKAPVFVLKKLLQFACSGDWCSVSHGGIIVLQGYIVKCLQQYFCRGRSAVYGCPLSRSTSCRRDVLQDCLEDAQPYKDCVAPHGAPVRWLVSRSRWR